jgi:hypothetical protein
MQRLFLGIRRSQYSFLKTEQLIEAWALTSIFSYMWIALYHLLHLPVTSVLFGHWQFGAIIWQEIIQLTCDKEASALCFHLSGAAFLVMTRRLARQVKQTAITGQPAKEIRNPIFIWNDTFVPVILKMRIINLVHFAFQQSWLKEVFSFQYTTCYKQLLRRSVPGLEIHRNGTLCPTLVNWLPPKFLRTNSDNGK